MKDTIKIDELSTILLTKFNYKKNGKNHTMLKSEKYHSLEKCKKHVLNKD